MDKRTPPWILILHKITVQLIQNGTRKEKLDVLSMTHTLMKGNSLSHQEKLYLVHLIQTHLTRRYKSFDFPRYVRLTSDQKVKSNNYVLAKQIEDLIHEDLFGPAREDSLSVRGLLKQLISLVFSKIWGAKGSK